MKPKYLICALLSLCLSRINTIASALQQSTDDKSFTKEDSVAVTALVLYPDTLRMDIFEACQYPGAIIKIASLQKSSSWDFTQLISNYTKEDQEDLWNLSRYPGLISKLVKGGKKSEDQIKTILSDYPDEIHEKAKKYADNNYNLLEKIDKLQDKINTQFGRIILDYPVVTQSALRELIGHPEIISLLNDHLSLTVRVGDHYRLNPKWMIHRADSMNLSEVSKHARDLEAWKQTMQQNPDEQKDLKNAANDYAQENGYSKDEVYTPANRDYVSYYNTYPYSYWFGYPTWYPYRYWYPYPYWFDSGFYYDMSGNMVIIGLPSHYFTNWYFYYPEHWTRYPHLGNTFVNYYYGPRRSLSSNSQIVHKWVQDNKNYLPGDFQTNNSKRVEAIKEIGQLNLDVQKQLRSKIISPRDRDEFFQTKSSQYPALNFTRQPETQVEGIRENKYNVIQQPIRQPSVQIAKPDQQRIPNQKQTTTTPPTENKFENMNRARDYHSKTWEQAEPRQQIQPQVQPREVPPADKPVRQAPNIPTRPEKRR